MRCIECGEEIEISGFGEFCVSCFLLKIAKPRSIFFILIFVAAAIVLFEILSFLMGANNLVVIVFIIFLMVSLRELLKTVKLREQG